MKAILSRFPTWQDVHQREEIFLRVAYLSEILFVTSAWLLTRLAWPFDFGMYLLIRKLHLENGVQAVPLVNK